jgi:hypothetical protein
VQIKDIIESMLKVKQGGTPHFKQTEHARRSRIKIAHMYSTSGSMLFLVLSHLILARMIYLIFLSVSFTTFFIFPCPEVGI